MNRFVYGVALTAVFLLLAWAYPQFQTVDAQQPTQATSIIDDFENGLPLGQDNNGLLVGYFTWNHPSATITFNTTTIPPTPVPDTPPANHVLAVTVNIGLDQFAGFSHTFTNSTTDEWLSQDWRGYDGISFWLYGRNNGSGIFIDILDNRNPGSTVDDAERWAVELMDNFTGWQHFEIPFTDFTRKEMGNGAPNDGFGRSEVWGYTVGFYGSPPLNGQTYFVDRVSLYKTCYPLTVTHTGAGSDPLPTPTNSAGCAAGSYVAGEEIALLAIPNAGWRVDRWQGSNNDGSSSTTNSLTMPNEAWSVAVTYKQLPTATATWTATPTKTATPTVTATKTATPMVTKTATPTATPITTPVPGDCAFVGDNGRFFHCAFLSFIRQPYFRRPHEAEPNDTPGEANGLILSNAIYQGTMSSADDSRDYYAFRLSRTGTAELFLSNIPAGHNYNLILRDETLAVVPGGNSSNLDNANEHIGPLTLTAGLYYIQIFNSSGTGSDQPYQLRVVYP